MTTAPAVSAGSAVSAAPVQYVVPRVHGDPTAARRLASSYRGLADEVAAAARLASVTVDGVSTWHGTGHRAAAHPVEVMTHNSAMTVRALHETADALDAYAHKLETAHSHHFFSLHKLVAVAAVVTVTAAAVVVTMGAAAAAEAAVAATAAGEATAAAGAAAAAGSGAAASLAESTATLVGVRALLTFVVPHLVQAELSAGFTASMEEAVDGHLDGRELTSAAAAGFAGSAGAAAATRVAESVKFAKAVWPFLAPVLPHVAQGAAWGGVDAGQQAVDGHFSLRELLLTAGLAGAASAGAGLLPAKPPLVARAYSGRQSLDDLLSGRVDLSMHEGDGLGHTLAKHVNVTDADLARRVVVEKRPFASRFDDATTASRAIAEVLRHSGAKIAKWLADDVQQIPLRWTFSQPVGVVMTANHQLVHARQVVVRLVRDSDGVFILTAYPELPRP